MRATNKGCSILKYDAA